MSNTIDILCVIDAATLAAKVASGSISAGTQANPTSLGSYSQSDTYVSMLTEGSYITNDKDGSELTITCDVGDNIRWTITNPGAGVNYSCMLYQFSSASIGTSPGVQYSWAFQLINQSGTVLGYFSWDPFIIINV